MSQCGGLPRKSTDFASHQVRLAMGAQAKQGISAFVVCVDLVAAYYGVIRQLALSVPHDEADLQRAHEQRSLPTALHSRILAISTTLPFWIGPCPTSIFSASSVKRSRGGIGR
eukprot:1143265-Pyramimonas_sp.AAC.1